MKQQQILIDVRIDAIMAEVAKESQSYFKKSGVVGRVKTDPKIAEILRETKKRWGKWMIDAVIARYIEHRVGKLLQTRDHNGIRVYECYAAGEPERRWMPLKHMDAIRLRAVMTQTRTLARQVTIKGEGYQLFLDEPQKLDKEKTVADVYDIVAPKLLKRRGNPPAAPMQKAI